METTDSNNGYPVWVEKHRRPNVYVNAVNGKYYLYSFKAVRDPVTGKVKKMNEEYLGRVTEADGFIPAKKRNVYAPLILEYGVFAFILHITKGCVKSLRRSFSPSVANSIYVYSIISFVYGEYNDIFFNNSYLNVLYSKVKFNPEQEQFQSAVTTILQQMKHYLTQFTDDHKLTKEHLFTVLHLIRRVKIRNKYYISVSDDVKQLLVDWQLVELLNNQ